MSTGKGAAVSKKKKNTLYVTAAVFLSLAAAVGGYKGARYIANSITVKAEENAEKAGLFTPKEFREETLPDKNSLIERDSEDRVVLKKTRPISLITVTDYETGKLEKMAVEIFDTVKMKVDFLYLNPDISFTMSASLYRQLANGNVLLPQTVTFRELYAYYGADSAYAAAKKIIGEMIGLEIDRYISYSLENAPEDFMIEKMTALGVKELFDERDARLTDAEKQGEEAVLPYCEALRDADVSGVTVPVIKRNESCFADISALYQIILDL